MSDAAPRSNEQSPEPLAPVAAPEATTSREVPAPPRSLRRRLAASAATARPPRVRSRPLDAPAQPVPRERAPVPIDWEPEPVTTPWRARPLVITLAVLAWLAALLLLLADPRRAGAAGGELRLLLLLTWALAAALTFVPLQWRLGLPGLGWQGIVGWSALGYLLAFAPAPRGWLLDLPELPVYLLLFFAVFYAVSAAMLPLTYLLGQRVYRLRVHRLDVRRARRQAYEVGLLVVAVLVLAGLRVLTPATVILLAAVVLLTEALLLSQMRPQG